MQATTLRVRSRACVHPVRAKCVQDLVRQVRSLDQPGYLLVITALSPPLQPAEPAASLLAKFVLRLIIKPSERRLSGRCRMKMSAASGRRRGEESDRLPALCCKNRLPRQQVNEVIMIEKYEQAEDCIANKARPSSRTKNHCSCR